MHQYVTFGKEPGARNRPVDAGVAFTNAMYGRHVWQPAPVPHAFLL
jgi:hypothetical protein